MVTFDATVVTEISLLSHKDINKCDRHRKF